MLPVAVLANCVPPAFDSRIFGRADKCQKVLVIRANINEAPSLPPPALSLSFSWSIFVAPFAKKSVR